MIQVTAIILVLSTVILITYDVYALWAGGVESTISRVIQRWSHQWATIALAWGVLAGHFFMPRHTSLAGSDINGLMLVIWVAWLVLILSWAGLTQRLDPWVWMLAGILIGWLFWPQPPLNQ